MFSQYIPKFFVCLQEGYSWLKIRKDLLAGLTVGIVSIPLAMAFAIASGVSPERGLYTAIVAGFLISFLGGSRVQIGGPTSAFIVIVWNAVQRHGYEGMVYATLLAGVLLLAAGIFRLGTLIKYIPYPLTIGFTTGIAFLLFSSQIKDFFGLRIVQLPGDFVGKWKVIFHALPTFDVLTCVFALGVLFTMIVIRKWLPRIPWGISAIAVATIVCVVLQLPVETIQSRFGEIPHSLPLPSLPQFTLSVSAVSALLPDALAIAFLAGVESLLSAVIADGMTGRRHKSNVELCGQGLANIASMFFGGIPATGAIARTAINVKTGAQTPLAGMVHALTILLVITFFSSLVSLIPIPALSAMLMIVAWNMSELHHFRRLFKAPIGDVFILLTAFFLTVLIDLTVAVEVGMVLAAFLFLKRMSTMSKVALVEMTKEEELPEKQDIDAIFRKDVPAQVEVYEVDGPLFFGIADSFKNILQDIESPPSVCILRMRKVPVIDASGMHALKDFHHKCAKQGTTLVLSGVKGQPYQSLNRYGLSKEIGHENIQPHIDAALLRARQILSACVRPTLETVEEQLPQK